MVHAVNVSEVERLTGLRATHTPMIHLVYTLYVVSHKYVPSGTQAVFEVHACVYMCVL